MDGIKKRLPKESMEVQTIEEKIQPPTFAKKEELYITKEEALDHLEHEKAFQKGRLVKKIFWLTLIVFAALITTYVLFFLWKTYAVAKKMNTSFEQPMSLTQNIKSMISQEADKYKLRGQENERINILLLGAAGEKKPGGNLTDTVMIMSINLKNHKVALLSLPRDLYTQIPESDSFTKINSLYKIGITQKKGPELIEKAVEKMTGIPMNYYVAVDFDAFQKIIDDLGGINIQVERDIYDARYPGPNYSYETFSLKKGAHLLDGATALKYVRERHDDPDGDFGRAKRQQQVIQSVKNKMFSMQTFFNVFALSNVLDTLGDNIKTNMSFNDIEQFVKLSRTLDTQNINNVVVDAWKADSLLKVSHVMIGNDRAFILVPRVGNYSEIKDLAQNIFDQTEMRKRSEMIKTEDAKITIINQSNDPQLDNKIKKLLNEKLGMKNVSIVHNETEEILQVSIITAKNGTEKIYTLDELTKKLPATLSNQAINSENDISIELGNDLADIYKYEEDTMEDLNNSSDKQEDIF
ncbi:MAG: putative transcription regulator [uncultured bacterium]|nr:MAG: putative transcription regulator [uncultured bacterium]